MEKPHFRILVIPDSGAEEIIECDGTLREAPSYSSMASQYPVGRGSVTTDHIQENPLNLIVDLFVTETPLRALENEQIDDFSIDDQTSKVGGGDALFFGPNRTLAPFERSRALVDRLNALRLSGQLVTVTTALGQHGNMAIIAIGAPIEGSDHSVVITVDFQQIRIADSAVTADVEIPRLRSRTNGGTQNGGSNASSPAPEEPSRDMLGAIGALLS